MNKTNYVKLNVGLKYKDKLKILNHYEYNIHRNLILTTLKPRTRSEIIQFYQHVHNKNIVLDVLTNMLFSDVYNHYVPNIMLMFMIDINHYNRPLYSYHIRSTQNQSKMSFNNFRQIDQFYSLYDECYHTGYNYYIYFYPKYEIALDDKSRDYLLDKYKHVMPIEHMWMAMYRFQHIVYFITERQSEIAKFLENHRHDIQLRETIFRSSFSVEQHKELRKLLQKSHIKRFRRLSSVSYDKLHAQNESTLPYEIKIIRHSTFTDFYNGVVEFIQKFKYFEKIIDSQTFKTYIRNNQQHIRRDILLKHNDLLTKKIKVREYDDEEDYHIEYKYVIETILYHGIHYMTLTDVIHIFEDFNIIHEEESKLFYLFPHILTTHSFVSMSDYKYVREKYPAHVICLVTNPRFFYDMDYPEYIEMIENACSDKYFDMQDIEIFNDKRIYRLFVVNYGNTEGILNTNHSTFEQMIWLKRSISVIQRAFLEMYYHPSNMVPKIIENETIKDKYADT
jgi:hypothetical protein